jgi:hypothetical protein
MVEGDGGCFASGNTKQNFARRLMQIGGL